MPSDDLFPIGRLALQTGVKDPTIRYYEQIALHDVPREVIVIVGSTTRGPSNA
jgi:hypothetical protein